MNIQRVLAILVTLVVLLSACSPASPVSPPATSAPTNAPIVLTDGLNHTLTLQSPARRIVSMAPSNTEILFAIGAGSQVVGRDEFSDYPAEAKQIQSIGGSFGKYNNETIVNLKPDLVLASEINTPEQVKALQDLGLNVYYLPNPKTLDEMYQNLQTVGKLTGHTAGADTLINSLKTRVQALETKLAGVKERPSVYYELDYSDPTAPYTSGPGTFVDLLIQKAGGQNIGSDLKDAWAKVSVEQIIVKNPDIILLGDGAYGITVESVKQRPGWENIQAVKDNQIYTFDDNLVSRPGPRLVDGLETLAKLLHPEAFK